MKKIALLIFLFVNAMTYAQDFVAENNDVLQTHLAYLQESWREVPNPIIATYQGNDFGDYFHIMFEDETGAYYDFGDGDNHFGKYKLFEESGQYEDNPKYLGKQFKIYWEWKTTQFPCCEGSYDIVEAKIPSIVRLKLMK